MSQVVVCEDNFSSERRKSLAQEKKITKDDGFSKWQRSDVTKTLMIERLIALLFAPIALFWALLLTCAGVAFALCLLVFKVFSKGIGFVMKKGQAQGG